MKALSSLLPSFIFGLGLIMSSCLAQAQEADPDWPCVQRLLPEIAGGMIWPGPPLDDIPKETGGDKLEALAGELAARRVPMEEAEKQIENFAAELNGADGVPELTNLFKASLDIINRDRASIIEGIKKFSRGQRNLADRITAKNQEIESTDRSEISKIDALRAERDWDIRIFEDRRQSLTYLCDQPVLLEQRAFALARAIASHLEQ